MDVTSLGAIPPGAELDADLCIVGSGPAGATLARELAGTPLRVVLLESGGIEIEDAPDLLNEIDNVGAPRVLDQTTRRNRVLGGTSYQWSGRCVELDEIDYCRRSWVPYSGWPIGPDELAGYLERSATHLGLGVGSGFSGDGFWSIAGRKPPAPPIDRDALLPVFWQYSRTRNPTEYMRFGPVLLAEQAPNLRVLTHATVTHINTDATASEVRSVEVAAPDDSRRTITTRHVALCAGGIENARLLLASNRVSPAGLGNGHDLVGRFLMDHPRGGVAKFERANSTQLEPHLGFYFVRTPRGTHLYCQGLRLSPAVQERESLLNCAVWLSELVAPDDPWSAVKRIARGQVNWKRDTLSLVGNSGLVARGVYNRLANGAGLPRKLDGLELNCIVEQRPDPASRVMLADRVDRHGVPISRVDWRRSDDERRTVGRMTALVTEALQTVGRPVPTPEGWLRDGAPFPDEFKDVAHHIGTTRMSKTPADGVVDTDCQVHGVRGLFAAGSSVFPTSGHANPTQTIVALAVRLADHLRGALSA